MGWPCQHTLLELALPGSFNTDVYNYSCVKENKLLTSYTGSPTWHSLKPRRAHPPRGRGEHRPADHLLWRVRQSSPGTPSQGEGRPGQAVKGIPPQKPLVPESTLAGQGARGWGMRGPRQGAGKTARSTAGRAGAHAAVVLQASQQARTATEGAITLHTRREPARQGPARPVTHDPVTGGQRSAAGPAPTIQGAGRGSGPLGNPPSRCVCTCRPVGKSSPPVPVLKQKTNK